MYGIRAPAARILRSTAVDDLQRLPRRSGCETALRVFADPGWRLSRPRGKQTFEGLRLGEQLPAEDTAPRCGLLVVDAETGRVEEWLRFEHTIDALYDVALLPGARQVEAVGFMGPKIELAVGAA